MRVTALRRIALALLLTAAVPDERVKVSSPADLPASSFALNHKPSILAIEAGAPLLRLSSAVETYVGHVLATSDVTDPGMKVRLLGALRNSALLEQRWSDAIRLSSEIRALHVKDGPSLVDGLVIDAKARAATVKPADVVAFRSAFEAELRRSVAAIPAGVADVAMKDLYAGYYIMNSNTVRGELQGRMDAAAEAQGMRLDLETAHALLDLAVRFKDVDAVAPIVVRVLGERLQSELRRQPDRWSERVVTLSREEIVEPVLIGIWDTGLDPGVFGSALWRNDREQINGIDDDANGFVDDLHGFAFDPDRRPTTGDLGQLPAETPEQYARLVRMMQGRANVMAAMDSPAARFFRDTLQTLAPEELGKLSVQLNRMRVYIHGTGTGSVSVEGNPGAILMNGRYSYRVEQVTPPIDEQDAEARARYSRKAIAYFRSNGVRIVNMSFRITEPSVESSLSSLEPDPVRRRERAKAIFETIAGAFEDAIRSAPEVLFIAAAGNENESIDSVRSAPAGLTLPNLLTVGAIDRAFQTAGFSSYGNAVDIYANGDQVPGKVPGGAVLSFSGTSSATPFVTNLAGKLLALCPTLTAASLRDIIEKTASDEGNLKVLDPRAAVSYVKERCCQSNYN